MQARQEFEIAGRRQWLFTEALGTLRGPGQGPVDIENAIVQIRGLGVLSPSQARDVLSLASERVLSWVEAAGVEPVIDVLFPAIDTFRVHTESSDKPSDRIEFRNMSIGLVEGIVQADPDAYQHYLSPMIKAGRFGEVGKAIADTMDSYLDRPTRRTTHGKLAILAAELDLLIEKGTPESIAQLKANLPIELLLYDRRHETFDAYPRVSELFDGAFERDDIYPQLAVNLLSNDREIDWKNRIKSGEFGEPLYAFGAVLTSMLSTDEEQFVNYEKDSIEHDLWVELVEIDRHDPRLRPLRERLLGKSWYWDAESTTYTLVDTVNELGVKPGEESEFTKKHEDVIAQELLHIVRDYGRMYKLGLNETVRRGELGDRLGVFLSEVRNMLKGRSPEYLIENFPDSLLFASLYSPSAKPSE